MHVHVHVCCGGKGFLKAKVIVTNCLKDGGEEEDIWGVEMFKEGSWPKMEKIRKLLKQMKMV